MKATVVFDNTTDEINLQAKENILVSSATGCRHYVKDLDVNIQTIDSFEWTNDTTAFYFINLIGEPGDYLSTDNEKNIFWNLPSRVLDLAQQGKIALVLDNRLEGSEFCLGKNQIQSGYFGDSLFLRDIDYFDHMHNNLDKFKIDKIYFINGDHNFRKTYSSWCRTRSISERIQQHAVIFWTIILRDRFPSYPLIFDAIDDPSSKNFNSLNRTSRPHKNDHIRWLSREQLLNAGLISHHYTTDNISPMYIDGDFSTRNPDADNVSVFNHRIYQNSLLTFTTETGFYTDSLFITEKTFKPIAAGHPFLLLGPSGTLEKLKQLGYLVDFSFFEPYDHLTDHYDRFGRVHKNLKRWIQMPREAKINLINDNMNLIIHNQNHCRENFFYHKKFFEGFF